MASPLRIELVLVSRFLLDLRDAQATSVTSHASQFTISGFRVPTLQDIAGDMGQQLRAVWHEDAEDDVDSDVSQAAAADPTTSRVSMNGSTSPHSSLGQHHSAHGDAVRDEGTMTPWSNSSD